MWNVKKGLSTMHLGDSLNEFKSFLPSLVLCGSETTPPPLYSVDGKGVQLVCKYLKLYKNQNLDNHLMKGSYIYAVYEVQNVIMGGAND